MRRISASTKIAKFARGEPWFATQRFASERPVVWLTNDAAAWYDCTNADRSGQNGRRR
jgi:hypothetical protein